MLNLKPILAIVVPVFLLAACNSQIGSGAGANPTPMGSMALDIATPIIAASVSNSVLDICPITRPQNPIFVPPPPWPPKAPYNEFWYGSENLWTAVRPDGIWRALPQNATGYTQKVWFWKKGYSGPSEPTPNLAVTGRRLDGFAPPLVSSRATNGYHADFNWAMLVGVDLPTLGCWEITGHVDGHDLRFVVWVAS